MPEELDEVNRKLMQLEIERVSLKKEETDSAKKRLEEMSEEISNLKSKKDELTAKWQNEKAALESSKQIKTELDKAKLALDKALNDADYNEAARLQNFVIPSLNKKLKEIGFRIYILSNNHQKRTKLYTTKFLVDGYLVLARKPFVYKIRPFLKKENIEITNTILIGDQLLTDIKCANKLGLDSVLVKSISRKSEKWYTRINRLREKRVINNIAKVDKEKAIAIAKIIGERNDSNE